MKIRVFQWTVALLVTVLSAVPAVRAVEVAGLYQATVPVASREDERQRARAFAAGMREMLVRLTGHDDVTQHPDVLQALSSPAAYVESWAYQTRPDPLTQEQRITIDISFFPAGVQRLLTSAGVALWPQNRPQTLVWIILQDPAGTQYLVNPEAGTGAGEWQALQTVAGLRGLPLALPHWDYEDQTTLLPEQLWALDEAAIRTASGRYGLDSVVAIRAERLASGHVTGKALHVFRDRVHETELTDVPAADFLNATVGMVTRELADNYGVRVSTTVPGAARSDDAPALLLSVDGVRGLDDYAGVLRYVEGLPGIADLQVREANAGTLTFSLDAAGQVRQLVENLAVDRKLQPEGNQSTEGAQVHLRYRWQPR